ncbi:MAG: hypothetical protein ABSA92_16690 [Candidatus Bathyarchaeia archaeon]|jgi:hypothetical protein
MTTLAYLRKFRVMPYWNEERGLFFRPDIGQDARQRFQEVLHLYGKEDVQRVRHEAGIQSATRRNLNRMQPGQPEGG